MSLNLNTDLLLKHNVCRDGVTKFRRRFTRSKTWTTLEQFEQDLRQFASEWDWSEAQEKFGIEEEEYNHLAEDIRDKANEEDSDEEGWSERQCNATAWARLYWAKMIGTPAGPVSKLPQVTRAYLKAVEDYERSLKFKAKGMPARVDISFEGTPYYSNGIDTGVRAYIGQRVKETMVEFTENAISFFESEVARTRQAIQDTLTAEATPVAVQPAAIAAE